MRLTKNVDETRITCPNCEKKVIRVSDKLCRNCKPKGCGSHLSEQWHCGDTNKGYMQLCHDCTN